jgi:ParB-like chromosome segregation protein Spo0J
MVQLLDDEQAMEVQIIENLQRKDVTAIEEAEGFQRLLKGLEATQETAADHGRATRTELVQTIASRIGKSVRYVWARMKLVSLVPEVKQALEAGKIEASHADLLVSFPPEKQKEIFIENVHRACVWRRSSHSTLNRRMTTSERSGRSTRRADRGPRAEAAARAAMALS